MINLYYCLKNYIEEDGFTYSFGDYNMNLKNSICIIFRDGGATHRDLTSGKYINRITRFEIVGVAGRKQEDILQMESYLSKVKEKMEVLNNKHLTSGESQVFISRTDTGDVHHLGKNQQDFTTFSLNGLIIYK